MPIAKTLKFRHTYKKLLVAVVVGALAVIIAVWLGLAKFALLIAWDTGVLVYIIIVWATVWGMDSSETRLHAAREDPGRAAADLLLIIASIASLVAVVFLILQASHTTGIAKTIDISVGLLSVIVSWLLVNTTYTLRYARLYYCKSGGEVDFHEKDLPQYTDFAYLAFTLGMTFQVSDTDLKTKEIRATALRHAMLSFLFSTVIIATTINAMVSLSQ